ncbi:MAG: hypothetical protein Q9224_000521 [Gallowayella concinna]
MQNRPFSPTNPLRTGGILPPLSKYYYGPAVSPDRTPVNVPNTGWNATNPQQDPPALPPRHPPTTASAPPLSQQSPYHDASSQQYGLPGPPPTAPPTHPVARSSYNPNNYGLMPGPRYSPINATWNQSSSSLVQPDTSTWGVNYNDNNAQQIHSGLKPPLPPRASSSQSQGYSPTYENQARPSQQNGSIEYLRPVAYSPAPSPSIPQGISPPTIDETQQPSWQPEPQRGPPPPPPKIPSVEESVPEKKSNTPPGWPQTTGGPFPEHDRSSDFEARPLDDKIDQPRPHAESLHKTAPQDYGGGAFVSPQSTGNRQSDNYYPSSHPRRKDTSDSGWSFQSSNGPAGSTLPKSEAWPSENASPRDVEPSASFIYEDDERFTLRRNDQADRVAYNKTEGQNRVDSFDAVEGTHSNGGSSNDWGQGPQIPLEASSSVGQDTIASSVPGEEDPASNNNDQAQRDDSFYWHSPQTSASTSHDRDHNRDVPGTSALLDATPEPQEQHTSYPPKDVNSGGTSEHTKSLYQPIVGPYGASALGFGGPSDWEHFGDYDGEEVDDTDLYLRPRSPTKQTVPIDTAELPADSTPANVRTKQASTMYEEPSQEASSAQPKAIGSVPHEESQVVKVQDEGRKTQPSEGNVNDTSETSALEEAVPETTHRGHEPLSKEQKLMPKRDSAPKLPMLEFEQVQHEPEQTPRAAEEDAESCTDNAVDRSPKSQTPTLSGLHSDEAAEAPTVGPETVYDKPAAKVAPPLDVQDRVEISRPSAGVDGTSREYQDQPLQEDAQQISDIHDFSREDSVKRASLVSDGSAISKIKEPSDPYADLDPWAKASLNRYVAMLHEEARASTDLDKLKMFKAFSRKEWRLRAVLYGADDEQVDDLFKTRKDSSVQRANTLEFRRPASKALPALPTDADRSSPQRSQEVSVASSKMQAPTLAKLMTTTEEEVQTRSSGEESYIVVDTPSGRRQHEPEEETNESYSPGGRPIQAQAREPRKAVTQPSPYTNNPNNTRYSVVSNDSKPAYTPFRYSQGYVDDADQPVDRRASFRPYAALKLEPVEDHAETAPELVLEASRLTALSQNGDDLESASIREQVSSSKQGSAVTKSQDSSPVEQGKPPDLRRFERADFDPLTAVLPSLGSIPQSAVELSSFQCGINAVPDDFGFIHQHVMAWDTKAKRIRAEHEQERQMRQTESEQRIDALFNEDEIGYGDIGELEEEFKKAEAARKTSEDRAEYSTFVDEVFNAVWARLHFEIDQLTPLYDEHTSLAHETVAGKDMFEAVEGQHALAPTMSSLLTLHQKVEIRHQKAFEAVLERDRRLKKTEVAPWYTLGNVAKVKQLEKQFDRAEKKAILEYCKQKDARANRLMDVLDQNTLRGVGANQDYMEAVMKAVRRIASGRAFASAPANEPGLGMDEVVKAKAVTAVLASSSEQIVQTFHVADMLLNAADYELSVATAKLANAESTTFERLKDERGAEDAKLMRDLQHRLALIREDSRRTNDEIVKLLCFLGVQGGHAQAGMMPSMGSNTDPGHEQRLQKALDDAKRRNAEKAAGGEGIPS